MPRISKNAVDSLLPANASEHLAPHQWSDAWYAVQKPVAPHWNVAAAGSDLSPGALLMGRAARLEGQASRRLLLSSALGAHGQNPREVSADRRGSTYPSLEG